MADATDNKNKAGEQITASSALVFISHDTRDAELAEAFSKLLSSVSCGVLKSFRSSDKRGSQGIEYGAEWYPELMTKLGSASDVVCLLTKRSLDRPWILYEAGVAKGKLNTPVHAVALGIPFAHAITGPFAQFQNCSDDEESLVKLVTQLLSRIPNAEPDEETVKMQVKAFKQKADQLLKKISDAKDSKPEKPEVDATSVAKLFEEVKVMFQDLPSRLEGRIGSVEPSRRRRFRKMHPHMMEIIVSKTEEVGEATGLLMLLAFMRDDFPWLYEFGKEMADLMKAGEFEQVEKMYDRFQWLLEFTFHGPGLREMASNEESFMQMRESYEPLFHYLHQAVRRYLSRRASDGRTKKK